MNHLLERCSAAALEGGAMWAHSSYYDDERQVGITFGKNGREHALRFNITNPEADIELVRGIVSAWSRREAA